MTHLRFALPLTVLCLISCALGPVAPSDDGGTGAASGGGAATGGGTASGGGQSTGGGATGGGGLSAGGGAAGGGGAAAGGGSAGPMDCKGLGCQLADGGCSSGTNLNSCGAGGNACVKCNFLDYTGCSGGACNGPGLFIYPCRSTCRPDAGVCSNDDPYWQTCVPDAGAPKPPADLGAPCTNDSGCAFGFCKLTTSSGVAYPEGYCTQRCGANQPACPEGSVCLGSLAAHGETDTFCSRKCTGTDRGPSQWSCRSGYQCYPAGPKVNACWIARYAE